ncbi:probable 2-oxoglutarate dehydrogenase E1 component DHKTD1 homolog, mitochondrial [Anopheles ziemanni]|uniref:probable 2-oxoglutarate dehydrogenase E1 component DHKTD1 homolog, mitochondrial n=1 Tax=Anopheles coustani TaxID=139045 RepID=UPI0026585415|nr:probable 2-oxoglutarate dehydrogenase E1 component DHKTD1 homolog, mitochondrial [Anopheles coustani]XP_058175507.1 probable 2-oxoglutarate dehydrogenase E1 component DHKTD1 homolog, mitochondrial [Anopheles ziemanni]
MMFSRLVLARGYHSTKGVFGYRPRPKPHYEGLNGAVQEQRNRNGNVYRWIEAYRHHGHRIASIDPVRFRAPGKPDTGEALPELDYTRYGVKAADRIDPSGLLHVPAPTPGTLSPEELDRVLREMYCGTCSIELAFIESQEEREWLTERYERLSERQMGADERREIAELMLKSQAFDHFLATKFPTVKRYGGEGAESMMAFYRELFRCAADADLRNIVIGMPHRGKLNVLTTLFGTRPAKIFRKFKGYPEFPADAHAMCDIASHFHTSTDITVGGKTFHLNMLHNPSHLEAVNPVSMGKTRAKQLALRDGPYGDDPAAGPSKALNVQVHGDAAFPGQGINQECLLMAEVPHFEVNGTIHLVVNNQVGFTTPAARGRGTRYVTDLAKSIMAPIVHVNADDPEALTRVTQLAVDYRQRFGKDFFIDLNCFRRWGHNELDDPTMTNPLLYKVVHARPSIPDAYARKLIDAGLLDQDDVNAISKSYQNHLTAELQAHEQYEPERSYFERQWSGLQQPGDEVTVWNTGLDYRLLSHIGRESVRLPEDFNVHPHLKKTHVDARLRRLADGQRIDWATAETLAIGSLLYQGYNVRLSGEDVGRGTFSQRHAMLVDQETNEIYIPLNGMAADGVPELGRFELANSILSEEAVLGFEYGMAIDSPNSLVIWEAQFGDFFNGAQIIIDTFLVSGETKWMVCNGLVMLLPHGYDGAASEHSSCRMERFLQMTDSRESSPDGDDVNLQIINPSTPAQYFHALRRQMIRNYRKPLLVVAPKTLLRLSDCVSTHADFAPGTYFQPVLSDPADGATVDPKRVRRVVLCSGKHYYTLQAERKARNVNDVALVRLESLCPFPVQAIRDELAKYPNAREFVWSQEEHRNMGAWTFVQPRFENMCERRIQYRGRAEGATVAVGVSKWHTQQLEDVIKTTFQ